MVIPVAAWIIVMFLSPIWAPGIWYFLGKIQNGKTVRDHGNIYLFRNRYVKTVLIQSVILSWITLALLSFTIANIRTNYGESWIGEVNSMWSSAGSPITSIWTAWIVGAVVTGILYYLDPEPSGETIGSAAIHVMLIIIPVIGSLIVGLIWTVFSNAWYLVIALSA